MAHLRGVGIGAGYFSAFQYEAWSRIPEVTITAISDLVPEKARAAAERHGIARCYENWQEMIEREQPDFVDIITPPDTHEEICAFAASRGVNIICQKPLAPGFETGCRIVENARRAGVRFMVHENWRWQPWYREIKRIHQSGAIGGFTHAIFIMRMGDGWGPDSYLSRQPFFRRYPRLLVFETGVHFIDTFRFLFGEIREIYASLRRLNPVIQGEDAGELFFRFESGATATWDANRYNEVESPDPRYTFGRMRIDATGGHLELDTEGNLRLKPLGQPGHAVEYPHSRAGFAGDCVYALQRHFVDCMLSGAEFESSGEDYLKTLAVVEAAYESDRRKQVVSL